MFGRMTLLPHERFRAEHRFQFNQIREKAPSPKPTRIQNRPSSEQPTDQPERQANQIAFDDKNQAET
jgi:hypothetical protein